MQVNLIRIRLKSISRNFSTRARSQLSRIPGAGFGRIDAQSGRRVLGRSRNEAAEGMFVGHAFWSSTKKSRQLGLAGAQQSRWTSDLPVSLNYECARTFSCDRHSGWHTQPAFDRDPPCFVLHFFPVDSGNTFSSFLITLAFWRLVRCYI